MKNRLNMIVNVAILTTIAFLLLGPSGPLGRLIGHAYADWMERRQIAAAWPDLVNSSAILTQTAYDDDVPTIIEFVDYECPSCRQLSPAVSAFVASGRARVVIRQFPMIGLHQKARDAAAAALCAADQGQFSEVHNILLTDDAWTDLANWDGLATNAGVADIDGFRKCMNDRATDARIDADISIGKALGVRGTPTFVSRNGVFAGTVGLDKAMASALSLNQGQEEPIPPLMHVGEADVFDSSEHPNSSVSQIGGLATAFFVDEHRLVIGDRLNAELHLVDLQDGSVRSVGRHGDGPGEFRLLTEMLRTPDGFATWDVALARITWFSGAGDVMDTWAYNRLWFKKPVATPVAMLADGLVIFRDGEEPTNRLGRYREEIRYVAVARDGIVGAIADARGPEYWMHANGFQPVMLGHILLEAQIGDQIAIAQTDLSAIKIVDGHGATNAELPMAQGRMASAKQIEMLRERARERLRRRVARPSAGLLRESARANLENVDDVPANETTPPIDHLIVDRDGRLWLRSYAMPDDEDVRWEAWNPTDMSAPEFVVSFQSTSELLDASGAHVLLHERDSMGVDRVFVATLASED